MLKVIIVGAYPPPIGGNSVHIKRLKDELDSNNIECVALDIYGNANIASDHGVVRIGPTGILSLLSAILFLRKNESHVVHFHVSALGKFLYLGTFMLLPLREGTKTVLTIHSGSFVRKYEKYNYFKKMLARRLLRSFSHVITVSHEQKNLLSREGISEKCLSVIPAYLPPTPEADVTLDRILCDLKSQSRKIIITSGYGLPLYGFDLIIKAVLSDRLIDKVSLLICTYNTYDMIYMSSLENIAADYPNIRIIRELNAEKFSYLLKKSDVYVRATDRDGDAVAIREANYFGLSVVASNVVKRPEYCHLFNTLDHDGLVASIDSAILGAAEIDVNCGTNADNYEKILAIYDMA